MSTVTTFPSGKGVARWREICEILSREVLEGRFATGRLPIEPDLAERFGVNRHTVRQALGALADQGLVRVEQGRGTFVADDHVDYLLGRRTRFSANLERAGREPVHRLLAQALTVADDAIARDLETSPGASLIQLEVVSEADGVPLSFNIHLFPAERFAALPAAFVETRSITAALAACGVADYTRRRTRLLARMPSEREARHLRQPLARPVLQAESINVDAAGAPIQRSITVFAGDRVQMVVADEAPGGPAPV
jgi:GntR family phosphonate transport system transcriptional regulator